MKPPPKTILIFDNLSVVVFDQQGEQIPELQEKSLSSMFAEYMEQCGYDPEGVIYETQNGRKWKFYKTECGWNRELV